MKKIAIIGNGSIFNYEIIKATISEYSEIIIADGGLGHCRAMDLLPLLIVGDLDSAKSEDLEYYKEVPKKIYPTNKDLTDMELAIQECIDRGAHKIALFGALGKRIDHGLKNLNLVYESLGRIVIESEYETIFTVTTKQTIPCLCGQTLSLISYGKEATGVTTHGLKWELNNATMNPSFSSISNIALKDSFTIEINSGSLLCSLVRKLD